MQMFVKLVIILQILLTLEITLINSQNATSPINSTTSTTTTPSTTVTTTTTSSTTTTTKKPNQIISREKFRSPFCFCDQQMKKCEINCCCDLDCSPKEKAIFSNCDDYDTISKLGVRTKVKEKSCHRTDYIYRNNTPYTISKESRNLFCLVTNNFQQEEVLDAIPISKLKTIKTQPSFHWTSLVSLNVKKLEVSKDGYKYGSLILIAHQSEENNSTEFLVKYFELPSNIHGKSCVGVEPIKFLHNSQVTCQHEFSASQLSAICQTSSYFNANSYFDPATIIIGTIDFKSVEDKLVHFIIQICHVQEHGQAKSSDEQLVCVDLKNGDLIPAPKYESNACKNVLEFAQVTIVHDGVLGIINIFVQLHLSRITGLGLGPRQGERQLELKQQFKVHFFWKDEYELLSTSTSSTNMSNVIGNANLPKSGNPGYLVGKEIITGVLITMEELKKSTSLGLGKLDNKTLIKLEQEIDGNDKRPAGIGLIGDDELEGGGYYLSITNSGNCQVHNRRSILFGMNMKSSCTLSLAKYKYCEELKLDLGTILLGIHPGNFTKKFVASFGNPFLLQTLQDWIPITLLNNPFSSSPNSVSLISNGCSNGLIISLHIKIIYAYVGPVSFPQAQIRAIIYEFGQPILIKAKDSLANNARKERIRSLTLSTTVEFQDITSTPIHKIPEWPAISIQLPSNFFYPFSSSGGACLGNKIVLGFTSVQLLLLFIYYYFPIL